MVSRAVRVRMALPFGSHRKARPMSQTKRILGILIVGLTALSIRALATCQAALLVINLDGVTLNFAGTGDPYPEDWRTAGDRHVVDANAALIARAGPYQDVFRDTGLLEILSEKATSPSCPRGALHTASGLPSGGPASPRGMQPPRPTRPVRRRVMCRNRRHTP
jgi:hypothetical protein